MKEIFEAVELELIIMIGEDIITASFGDGNNSGEAEA